MFLFVKHDKLNTLKCKFIKYLNKPDLGHINTTIIKFKYGLKY